MEQPLIRVTGISIPGPTGIDLTFTGMLEYDGGRVAQILSSFDLPFNTRVDIYGDAGHIGIPKAFMRMEDIGYFTFDKGEDVPEQVRYPAKELYLCEVEDMEAAILDEKPNEVTLHQTRDHIRTIEALLASAKSRKPVDLA